jgi:Fur family ferric uptake transcriptional regulator
MDGTNNWSAALRKRNLKATSNRVEVLHTIEEFDKAIPHSKIQNRLQKVDRVTLYRTLNSLIESGMIHKVSVENDEIFYAICSQKCTTEEHNHQHVHFKCTSCNEVSCVQSNSIETLNLPGYKIESFEIQAKGVCSNCS